MYARHQFCGSSASDKDISLSLLSSSSDRISVENYLDVLVNDQPHLIIDVRSIVETDICRLPASTNASSWVLPIEELKRRLSEKQESEMLRKEIMERLRNNCDQSLSSSSVFVVCRRGNDSQIAVSLLKSTLMKDVVKDDDAMICVKDIVGGLHAWAKRIDSTFPVY